MKSTTAFALAASVIPFAFASPYHLAQHAARDDTVVDVVTDVEVVTAYQFVTWTEGTPAATTTVTSDAADETSVAKKENNGQHHWTYSRSSSAEETTTYVAPVPTTTTTSSVYTTPVEYSTTSTSSVYVAPSTTETSSTSVYVTPTTTAAATTSAAAGYVDVGSGPYEVPQLASSDATNSNAVPATTLSAYITATTGDASYDSSSGDLQASTLNSTNTWRAMFDAEPLTWSDNLEARALATAQACNWTHSNAGQNYAAGYDGPQSSIEGWGNEYIGYDFNPPDWSESAGHFTQLVWQGSETIGCAAYNCPEDAAGGAHGWFFVCNYLPVGNMLGEFPENVHAKVS